MQFILTKNEQAAAANIILERITENFEEVEIQPKVFETRLRVELAIYSDKEQKKLKTKYRNLLEGKFKKFIPNGNKHIKVWIQLLADGVHLVCTTEKERKHLIVSVDEYGYLVIK